MKRRGLYSVFLLIAVFYGNSSVFSQNSKPPEIINRVTEPIPYCNDSVFIAPEITIQNLIVTDSIGGIKVSVIDYKKEEDALGYIPIPGLTYDWNEEFGYLLIGGIEPDTKYQEAVRNVYYKNISETPTLGNRKITITLRDADYLPFTGHFYMYIKKLNITWTESKLAADSMNYFGLQGYLATITSTEENDFIWTKMDGIGWIGASDEEEEGAWKWVTGPESGQQFWQGNQNGSPVNGMFSFWAQGEPNNAYGGQSYAHINQHPEKAPKSWNDLRNDGSQSNPLYYTPQGYVVEFGGMPGDSAINLFAIAEIDVSKIAFSGNRDFDLCFGSGIELNLLASNKYDYNWTPNEYIDDTTISNPYVNPKENTAYKVVGKYGECVDSAVFKVNVKPVPVSDLNDDINVICKGETITLDAGEHTSYLWNNETISRTIDATAEGLYTVKLTNSYGCSTLDTSVVQWSVTPKLDFNELTTLVCGSKEITLKLNFDKPVDSTFMSSLQSTVNIDDKTSLNPLVSAPEFGTYQMQLFFVDQNQCESIDTFNLDFHNQPTADFLLDDAKCQGYNLDLSYSGENFEPAHFYWYSNDTVFAEGVNLQKINIPLGYGQRDRTVGLLVNEQGCVSEKMVEVSVVPKVDFWVDEDPEGCSPLKLNFGNNDIEEIDKYFWQFGDGETSEEKEPEHTFVNNSESDKEYYVQLTVVSNEGCENTGFLEDKITVFAIPTIDLNFNENECYSKNASVWYLGSGNENDTYFWDLSDFQPDEIIQNPGISAGPLEFERLSSPTVDIGLRMVSANGCPSETISKTWKRKPHFKNEISFDKATGCPPLDISFSAPVSDYNDTLNYQWNFSDGTAEFGAEISKTVSLPNKKYDVTVIANSDLTYCSDTLILPEAVFAYPVPEVSFDANPSSVLISDPFISFENRSEGAEFFEWDFNDNSALSFEVNPQHQFSEMGFYNVLLTAWNEFGCMDSTSRVVAVEFEKIYPPTAFSPNAALEEDREFRLYAEGISDEGYLLQIFNRWGEVIFESKNQNVGWQGKMRNDNFAPAGVYTWVVQYLDLWGKHHQQQGTVTLLF
ncbi:MAG: gliding motility-associated C-terminal domain-containing protein [Prolixibacteraceae bacterium]|nr:gliding motility-associated C-terminal domain-containing protein [Prolixibacteraceae bacterium]